MKELKMEQVLNVFCTVLPGLSFDESPSELTH